MSKANLMKKLIVLMLACMIAAPLTSNASEPIPSQNPDRASNLSFGIAARGIGTDYGGELNFTTPYFSRERFALRFAFGFYRVPCG